MTKDVFTVDPSLSPLENQWLAAIPAKYRRPAWLCLKDMRATINFNNSIERQKATMCYMDAFVTAIGLAHNPEEETNEEDKSQEESNQEDGSQEGSSDPKDNNLDHDDGYRSP